MDKQTINIVQIFTLLTHVMTNKVKRGDNSPVPVYMILDGRRYRIDRLNVEQRPVDDSIECISLQGGLCE